MWGLLLAPILVCSTPDARAEYVAAVDVSSQAGQRVTDDQTGIADLKNQLALARWQLAEERSNPSGVVNLRLLNEIGRDIQIETRELAALQARYPADVAAYRKARAHADALYKSGACAVWDPDALH